MGPPRRRDRIPEGSEATPLRRGAGPIGVLRGGGAGRKER